MQVKDLQLKRALCSVLLVLLLNVVGMTRANAQIQGALNGVFSVSDNTQICFSKGNLQYQASTNTWRFAEHQWDFVGGSLDWGEDYGNVEGSSNNNISPTYSGWIDLFGWGTSGYNHGAVCYQPWSICEGNNEYYAYGSSNYNLYDQTGQADWGYNAISNGGNSVGQWKTLSLSEWNYLLFERPTASNMRYVKAKLNYVKGLILLPDNWNETVYSLNDDMYSYDNNNINTTDWENLLEPNGAVFLPAAGARFFYGGYEPWEPWDDFKRDLIGDEGYWEYYNYNGYDGYYWTTSSANEDYVSGLTFSNYGQANGYDVQRQNGYSVRLVHVTQATSYYISTPVNLNYGGTVLGAGFYEPNDTCILTAIPNENYTFYYWKEGEEIVSTDSIFSFPVTRNRQVMAVFANSNNGPLAYTDLGLPSGLLWATCNVGAYSPEDFGNYYAWGETTLKDYYNWSNYQHCYYIDYNEHYLTKYCTQYSYGYNNFTDNLTTLLPEDDAATTNWGAGWHTPTKDEWLELFANTTNIWTTQNGVKGFLFTASNGNSLFLPACGYREYGINFYGNECYYWSSSLDTSWGNNGAWGFRNSMGNHTRCYGECVRAVRSSSQSIVNAVANPTEGGSVNGGGSYQPGTNCTLTATANDGYAFTNWTENGEVVSTDATYSFTVTGDRSLVANFDIIYLFNTYVDADIYPMNTTIPIHGTVTDIENNPVANLEVEIGITVMDWKRTLQAITDENGQFTATFEPLPMESGYYTVNSGQVGNNSTEVHDSFDIMGMTILEKTIEDMQVVNDYWILCDVIENIPKTGLVKIINRNSFALTNIQVNVLSAPTGCEFTFAPMDLAGLSEGYLSFTALGTIPTQGYEYQEVRLKATCDQGAEAMFTIWFYCEEAWGTLEVSPSSLNTTMTKGKSKTLDVTLTNNGTGATGAITVSLPNNMEWMSVVGGTTLPSIAVNESTTFTLRLSPSNDLPLGQFTGTIGINCEHSDGVSLPYTITAVSDENGALVVDVTDEFTTNTNNGNGPHVEGAEVTLTGYYSHDIVAHGYTGVDGVFSVDSITEGYYILNVSAERHSYYESTILVEAGVTKQMDVFLQYQGVSYSWVVEPTEIQDEYTIVLDMVFEVNVPIPVVTLGAPQRIPEFEDSYTFNYVVTNHGLVDALNLTLYVPENEYYLFTALYDHIDTLHAQSTVEIPCVVTRKSNLTIGCGEWALSRVQYSYLSGEELMYNQAIAYTLLSEFASCNQNLPSLGGGYGGYIGGGGYGGGSGSGGSGGGSGSGGSGGTGTGGHGAPSHPGHGGHGGNGGSGSGNSSTPLVYNQIPSVNVRVGVQFSQRLTMTREAFIGTFAVHNGHTSNAVTGIGLDFIIKDEEGNDRTNLFQISVDTLINVTGIDGDGTLAAGMDGVVKILFIPTREAAPADSVVYSFGGNFSFVDPWNTVSYTMNLLPAYLTVHPSPDLHIDYFVASNVYGDNLLTPEEEPTIPAELAVRIWNKGAGTAKNVILQTAKPVIVENSQGLTIEDFGLYGAYIDGIGVQIGLDSIVFGNIESGQAKVREWLYTSPLFAHMVSYNAQVIHNNSFDNPKLSLVSHVGIHSLTHAIRSQANRTDDINDFLVDDVPDENNYPDTIYFSNGGKTSVGVVGSISFDHFVSNHDTIVTLTVNPSRIGWNYGETEDPGRNFYELVSCTRNNDNKVIPLSNVWQEAMILPNSGDSIYVNKLRIVDTVSAVQTVTYTLVYASNPSEPSQLPIGAIDGLFSVSNAKKVYFSQGNLQYQASTDTWRFADNQYDFIGEGNANISQSYDGWIDLFGWGTSGYNHGAVCYQPWSTSQTNSDYYAYGIDSCNLFDQTGQADWGYNAISNGGNQPNYWRTLTYAEWYCVCNTRNTPSGIRYAKAQVNDIYGLILLPDNWSTTIYSLSSPNTPDASFSSNVISLSQWAILEDAGAVFLPVTGTRGGASVYWMDRAFYWSSRYYNGNNATALSFGIRNNDEDYFGFYADDRNSGHAVRLVKTVTYTINTASSPVGGGTVIGAGTYDSGETCTLTATANEGYAFVNWTENGNTVSTNSTISFVVSSERNVVANFLYIGTEEMINGLFSVSNNTKVCFSQGNLQYQASTNTWRFADHQWDYVGGTAMGVHYGNVGSSSNSNISSTYDGWIDLFGWGTSGWDNGNTCYHPWDINSDNDGTLFGPPGKNNLVGEYANADWGVYNPISNGGNQANQWRTLTYWEWDYLFNTRATSSGVRYAKAQLNGVNGFILVPDNWDATVYELQNSNTSESPFNSNVIDLIVWINTFESNGAVFLPAAGARFYGTTMFYLNDHGYYWSSTSHGNLEDYASNWGFSDEWLNHFAGNRSTGCSVRLVKTIQHRFTTAGTWSTASNWQSGTLPGATDEVFIDAPCQLDQNATVAALTVSNGQSLTLQSGKILTVTGNLTNTVAAGLVIEDGAQLVHNVANVQATVRKVISPFSGSGDGWHLIALPLTGSSNVASVTNLLEGEYDLYGYDEATTYWRNQKHTESGFTALEATKGYLYANSAEVTLGFSGTLENSSSIVSVPLSYTEGANLSGFNLVGNPFPCNAYLNKDYYVLSEDGSGIAPNPISADTPIPPCTAVFVKAVAEGETVVFTRVVQ